MGLAVARCRASRVEVAQRCADQEPHRDEAIHRLSGILLPAHHIRQDVWLDTGEAAGIALSRHHAYSVTSRPATERLGQPQRLAMSDHPLVHLRITHDTLSTERLAGAFGPQLALHIRGGHSRTHNDRGMQRIEASGALKGYGVNRGGLRCS